MSFRRVADVASLWPGEMKGLVVDTTKVLLLNVGGDVRAYEDSCPHRGVALSCGKLEAASGTLTCAMHLWQYDARTGRGVNPRGAALRRLPMKLEDDGIWVEVDGDAAAGDADAADRRGTGSGRCCRPVPSRTVSSPRSAS